jgi:DNA processing protein
METIESVPLQSAIGLITLQGVKGVGRVAVTKLLASYGTIGDVIAAPADELKHCVNEKQRSALQDNPEVLGRAFDDALRQSDKAEEHGYRMLSLYDAAYPARLRDIPNAPPVLIVSGPIENVDASVGFVGSDRPSDWGDYASFKMAEALAEKGWDIVSGMADGCQVSAHRAAMSQKARTVAVIPEGVDRLSWKRRDYAAAVLDAGGVVVTEQLFGSYADPSATIRRNRLISGLSLATFFIQGKMSPGLNDDDSIHAVRYAIQQNRPIFVPAIPSREIEDSRNETAINLARLTGEDLSLLWDARDDLKTALLSIGTDTVADAVAGKKDYPALLEFLDQLLIEDMGRSQALSYDDTELENVGMPLGMIA